MPNKKVSIIKNFFLLLIFLFSFFFYSYHKSYRPAHKATNSFLKNTLFCQVLSEAALAGYYFEVGISQNPFYDAQHIS